MRAAASSTARGRPSSRAQISSRAARFSSFRANRGSAPRARSTKSATASSRRSGSTGYSCSPEMRSAARLVTRNVRPGAASSTCDSIGAASASCSKLSITRSACRPARRSARLSRRGRSLALPDGHGLGDRGQQQRRVPDRVQRDEEGSVAELGGEDVCGLDGEPRLPRAAGPGQRQHPRVAAQRVGDLLELALPADERADRHGDVALGQRPPRERLVLAQDRLLEVPQLGARLEPELVEERLARLPVGLERVRLPSRAVEREHEEARGAARGSDAPRRATRARR